MARKKSASNILPFPTLKHRREQSRDELVATINRVADMWTGESEQGRIERLVVEASANLEARSREFSLVGAMRRPGETEHEAAIRIGDQMADNINSGRVKLGGFGSRNVGQEQRILQRLEALVERLEAREAGAPS